jgi:hypothetical protein
MDPVKSRRPPDDRRVATDQRLRTKTHGAIRATGNPAIAGHTGMAGIRGFATPACAGCAFWLARESQRARAGRAAAFGGSPGAAGPLKTAQRKLSREPDNRRSTARRLVT